MSNRNCKIDSGVAEEVLGIGSEKLAGYSIEEIKNFIRDVQSGIQGEKLNEEEIEESAKKIYEDANQEEYKMKVMIGSISSATMRKEDLIPVFVDEVLSYDKKNENALNIKKQMNEDDYFQSEDADYDLDLLFDELNNLCSDIPYVYFGAHPGDGADYGFWVDLDAVEEFDGLRVNDLSEVPDNYNGEVLHINDHDNITLYTSINGELTEIWAMV